MGKGWAAAGRLSNFWSLLLFGLKSLIGAHAACQQGHSVLFTTAIDATITSAVLDRLHHHGQTVVIEGRSFRMKDRSEN